MSNGHVQENAVCLVSYVVVLLFPIEQRFAENFVMDEPLEEALASTPEGFLLPPSEPLGLADFPNLNQDTQQCLQANSGWMAFVLDLPPDSRPRNGQVFCPSPRISWGILRLEEGNCRECPSASRRYAGRSGAAAFRIWRSYVRSMVH